MTTPNLSLPELTAAQAQPEVPVNAALRILDAVAQLAVLDKDTTAPPGSPVEGAAYIIPAAATGVWAGRADQVAVWTSGGWIYIQPRNGWEAWVADEGVRYRYGAGSPQAWVEVEAGGGSIAVSNLGSPGDNIPAVSSLQFSGAEVSDLGGGAALVTIAPPIGSGGVESVTAGTGISVDNTDPANPIVSASGGGGGGGDLYELLRDSKIFLATYNSITSTMRILGRTGLQFDASSSGVDVPDASGTLMQAIGWARFSPSAATSQRASISDTTNAHRLYRSTSSGYGGLRACFDFGYSSDSDSTIKSDSVFIFGFIGNNAVPAGSQVPSNLTNCSFIGKDEADTNLQFMHNDGSGTATKVDLGVTVASLSAIPLRLEITADATDIDYLLTRLDTGATVASGTVSTNIPVNTAGMWPIFWIGTGVTTSTGVRGRFGKWHAIQDY